MDHYSSLQSSTSASLNLTIPGTDQNHSMLGHESANGSAMLPETQMLASGMPAQRYMNQREKTLMYQLEKYYIEKAMARRRDIANTITEVVKIVQDVLKELELQEPRFISTFVDIDGYYEG